MITICKLRYKICQTILNILGHQDYVRPLWHYPLNVCPFVLLFNLSFFKCPSNDFSFLHIGLSWIHIAQTDTKVSFPCDVLCTFVHYRVCPSVFDLQLLNTTLVSSNFSSQSIHKNCTLQLICSR